MADSDDSFDKISDLDLTDLVEEECDDFAVIPPAHDAPKPTLQTPANTQEDHFSWLSREPYLPGEDPLDTRSRADAEAEYRTWLFSEPDSTPRRIEHRDVSTEVRQVWLQWYEYLIGKHHNRKTRGSKDLWQPAWMAETPAWQVETPRPPDLHTTRPPANVPMRGRDRPEMRPTPDQARSYFSRDDGGHLRLLAHSGAQWIWAPRDNVLVPAGKRAKATHRWRRHGLRDALPWPRGEYVSAELCNVGRVPSWGRKRTVASEYAPEAVVFVVRQGALEADEACARAMMCAQYLRAAGLGGVDVIVAETLGEDGDWERIEGA